MGELMNARNNSCNFRWQLLTTASALTLLAAVYGAGEAKAEDQDADHPTIWIELGGQLQRVDGQGSNFPVGFLASYPNSSVLQPVSPLRAQNPSPLGFAEEGKITIQPDDSDWVFSAGVNFGRSSNFKHVDHQTNQSHAKYINGVRANPMTAEEFSDTQVHHQESHAVLDFTAGKDVGLGIFGRQGSSTLNFGVRFAQFSSRTTFNIRARPDMHVKYFRYDTPSLQLTAPYLYFHTYHNIGAASRSFHAMGPSLSWNGSMPFVGNSQSGELSFDWGANVAILFGKQKARVQHHESGHYATRLSQQHVDSRYTLVYQHSGGHDTDRSVVTPNVGGFAGVSMRRGAAKISFGYRADFFFGAIDGGIDTRKSETLGFYGPFATISVGIGG